MWITAVQHMDRCDLQTVNNLVYCTSTLEEGTVEVRDKLTWIFFILVACAIAQCSIQGSVSEVATELHHLNRTLNDVQQQLPRRAP